MANPEYLALLQWGSQRWQISLKLIFPFKKKLYQEVIEEFKKYL